jgi:hypothetical protein
VLPPDDVDAPEPLAPPDVLSPPAFIAPPALVAPPEDVAPPVLPELCPELLPLHARMHIAGARRMERRRGVIFWSSKLAQECKAHALATPLVSSTCFCGQLCQLCQVLVNSS